MELACDPLDRELLEQKQGRADDDGEQDLGEERDCSLARGARRDRIAVLGLVVVDERLEGDVDRNRPREERDVSAARTRRRSIVGVARCMRTCGAPAATRCSAGC